MGISLEEFYKQMYKNSVNGDWQEFGDKALKLKWVDHIVQEIREESPINQAVKLQGRTTTLVNKKRKQV